MELKDFVSESLKQVLAGVRAAQSGEDGGLVNAKIPSTVARGGNLVSAGNVGIVSRVDFEVQVSAETSGGGGAKIQVLNVFGVDGSGQHTSKAANRLTFSVPVLLPAGGADDHERAGREKQEQLQKSNEGLARLAAGLNRSGVV